MKQIFDWLREQMRKEIVCTHVTPIKAEHARIIAYENAIKLVNEAEAKWETDCCEWRRLAIGNSVWKASCGKQRVITLNRDEKYCSYCGKPIKILEVE